MAVSSRTKFLISVLKGELKEETFKPLSASSKKQDVRIESDDRDKAYEKVGKLLKKKKLVHTKTDFGSVGSYDVSFGKFDVRLLFKTKSGGMSETTLNATITELVPCILFMHKKTSLIKKKTTKKDFLKVIKYLKDNPSKKVYVGSDAKAGQDFIKAMSESSKFVEKMINARAIVDYLINLSKTEGEIANLYWGYRAKPPGVSGSHKGDIFVKFKNGNMLGVSLKAGTGKSEEPKLNTYVNAVLENLGETRQLNKLKKKVYKDIHSTMGLPENWTVKSHIKLIQAYRKKVAERTLDAKYDKMLEMCRDSIVKAFDGEKKNTIKFIKEHIIAEQKDVPLLVVKALETGKYIILNEEDELENFLPSVKSVKAYANSTSKQNWHIELKAKKDILTLNMSIRTNKSKPFNKLAQGYNLAIKFNSVKHG
jgi:hypothetical protein